LLIAADPYETIAFKIPNKEIDRTEEKFTERWDSLKKSYVIQLFLKDRELKELPGLPEQARQTDLAFHGGGGFVR